MCSATTLITPPSPTSSLPRTNNAGAPSYTDGQWWWSLEDPQRPRFQRSRGSIETYACERLPAGAAPLTAPS